MALIIVFNNGTSHTIKNCDTVTKPQSGYYGEFSDKGRRIGTFLKLENISFYYFAEEEKADESFNCL